MKKITFSNRVCAVTFSSLLCFSTFAKDCIVNYTNFDTNIQLCDPELSNDLNGWYSDSIRNAACDSERETTFDHVKQGGMIRANIIFSNSITFDSLTKTISNPSGDAIGYLGIVGNPRTLFPYIMDTKSRNMIVTAGFGPNIPFMTYKLSNLKPGSNVTISFDAYNLYSIENMEEYLIAINENNGRNLIRQISLPGAMIFAMQSIGNKLATGSGNINGNKPSLDVCTDIMYVTASVNKVSLNASYGKYENIQLTTKADKNGEVTFYFKSKYPSTAPIGIDNIQIVGEAQPKINCLKKLPVCPAFPVNFEVENILDSVTYSWKCNSETSNDKTFSAIFDEANKLYKVECTIEANGCSSGTASLTVDTKECCSTADGKPLETIDIFFDDFGEFSNDNTEYTYIDSNGIKQTIPVTNGIFSNPEQPFTTILPNGASVPDFPAANNDDPINSWMITNVNPYIPGVIGDVSGTGRGGMLILDMSGDKKNNVVYRREVKGELKDKNINFGCNLGTINYDSEVTQANLLTIIKDGNNDTIFSKDITLIGNEGWISVDYNFVSPSNKLTVEIINAADYYGAHQGDIAIDNVVMSYCKDQKDTSVVIPALSIKYQTDAEDIKKLCKNDELTLSAIVPKPLTSIYESLKFLLQYSSDTINWITLFHNQSNDSFSLNEKNNPCFFDKFIGKNVYFRIVAADSLNLIGFENGNVGSDKVSISNHIVASSINCGSIDNHKCYTADGTPLPISYIFFDDFGEFSVDNTEYTYTESDGTKHTVSITNGIYTDSTRPFTTVLQQGVSIPDFPNSKYNPTNSWMIIKENPYTPGIIGDVSGTGRGGMLFLDMNGNDNLNKVIYRRTVNRIAIGTELEYGAFFGAANNNPNGIAELAIYIRDAKTNQTLDSITNIKLNGTEGWIEAEKKIVATCNDITFEIVNSVDNYMTSQGDIAIDNVHMEYCAMPDIAIESTISSEEALDLCQYDSLKLKTLMTESSKSAFNNPMYVFQYTTQDPSKFPFRTNEIWKNINEPSNESSIQLNKENCLLFDTHNTLFYFRVVVGDIDNIKEYMDTNAYS
ncbi:MAG: hypothetical protein J6X12_00240 [Paludibacteraceae bacterium]|nr:hypothetical protein [Paludibacteraceae bacterium]